MLAQQELSSKAIIKDDLSYLKNNTTNEQKLIKELQEKIKAYENQLAHLRWVNHCNVYG